MKLRRRLKDKVRLGYIPWSGKLLTLAELWVEIRLHLKIIAGQDASSQQNQALHWLLEQVKTKPWHDCFKVFLFLFFTQ